MLAASALPIQLFATIWLVADANLVTKEQWGLAYYLPFSEHIWVRTICLFFMLDACEYAYHRLMHAVKPFWRFHLVHHSDRVLDVSTTLREHPGESIIRNGLMIVWVFLCGASFEVLLIRQTVMSIFNLFAHGQATLPHRLAMRVQWLFVTPNFHRVHHHYRLPHTDSNFGDVFTIWDRMFRTYNRLPAGSVVCGVDTRWAGGQSAAYLEVLGLPFAPAEGVQLGVGQIDGKLV